MQQFRFRYHYTREPRKNITTSINAKLHKQFNELSQDIGQPMSKCYDVLLMEIFEDKRKLNEFIEKVKAY